MLFNSVVEPKALNSATFVGIDRNNSESPDKYLSEYTNIYLPN